MDEGVQYNQAANLEFRVAQAAKLLSGQDTSALPAHVQTSFEALSTSVARVLMGCRALTAPSCPTCAKQVDQDLACDCFATVAAE